MVDLRQLRYFVTVVEAGQMSRAAEQLHVAQPAISYAIRGLERQLGVQLLERHARGVEPTPAGHALLERARATLRAAEETENDMKRWATGQIGELLVGFLPTTLAAANLPFNAFRAQYPHVSLHIRELDFSEQLVELRAGRLDLEVVSPPPVAPDLDIEPFYVAPRVVLLSRKHRLAGQPTLTFDDIAEETHPGRHPAVPEAWCDDCWLTAQRGHRPPLTAETPVTPEEVTLLLADGKVIAVSPDFTARMYAGHDILAIPLVAVQPYVVALACRRDEERPAVRRLLEIAHETMHDRHPRRVGDSPASDSSTPTT